MKSKILITSFLLLQAAAFASPPGDGKTIFVSRCASCHNVNKQMTGPALAGLDERRSMDWIIRFIHSPQSVIKSGDSTAVGLFEKYNRVPMPDHTDLTDDDIKRVVDYIKSETKVGTESKELFAKPGKRMAHYTPLSLQKDWIIFLGFLIVVIMLISSLIFAVRLNEFKKAATQNKQG